MTPDELTRLRELHEKASPVPTANFVLTVEARNALPGLLDHIDRLTRRLEIYEARLGRVARNHPEAYEQALAGDTQ